MPLLVLNDGRCACLARSHRRRGLGHGAEGGDRRRGGSGSYRRRWRHGVLQAGVPEGGGKVVEELLQVGVVLLVPLVGVKMPCTSGSTVRPNGRRNRSFVGVAVRLFWWRKWKLVCLVSFCGSWQCC
jgi:hypothetical protein